MCTSATDVCLFVPGAAPGRAFAGAAPGADAAFSSRTLRSRGGGRTGFPTATAAFALGDAPFSGLTFS